VDVPVWKVAGVFASAGKQADFNSEKVKPPARQKALMTLSKFNELLANYEAD
jgi:hypothetical protein